MNPGNPEEHIDEFRIKSAVLTDMIADVATRLGMIPMSSGILTKDGSPLAVMGLAWGRNNAYSFVWALAGQINTRDDPEEFKREFLEQVEPYL